MNAPSVVGSKGIQTLLISGVSFGLGLLFNYFFYGNALGIAFFIFVGLILGSLVILSSFSQMHIPAETLWTIIPILFFSFMIFVRTSLLLTFLNVIACTLLILLLFATFHGKKLKDYNLKDFLVAQLPFIDPMKETLNDIFAFRESDQNKKIVSQVLKGILLSVPVLILFSILFSSADLIFKKKLLDVIEFDVGTVFQVFLVIFSTLFFIGIFSFVFRSSEVDSPQEDASKKSNVSFLGHIETSILFGSVNALFFFFILIQIRYLFAGQRAISELGFTYAQYARKGFLELVVVAIIVFFILWKAEQRTQKKGTAHSFLFKSLSTLLIIQVMFIMASAYKRLLMYEEAFGFTVLRLFSHGFVIWLGLIFLLFLYKIVYDHRENAFAFRGFLSVILFLAVMNILSPDAFIARQNMERFEDTGKIDIDYISSLSEDALPVSIALLEVPNVEIKSLYSQKIFLIREKVEKSPFFDSWQSLNLARIRASQIFREHEDEIERNKK